MADDEGLQDAACFLLVIEYLRSIFLYADYLTEAILESLI